MAKINIKRKREPLIISNERAKNVRELWVKNPKSTDLIDLDGWSGEINQIVSIELEPANYGTKTVDNFNDEYYRAKKAKLAQPPERRAKNLEEFKLMWFTRSNLTEKEAPKEALEKAEKISFEFFTKNPKEFRVPYSVFEPILFAKFGLRGNSRSVEKIAEKMEVETEVKASDIPF